ncbi:MAG: hypothetical protein M3Y69_06030 [Verrucomicrobiota bacterium]|nr:hypothetical protein [Verrucomicrobiota bacterium]
MSLNKDRYNGRRHEEGTALIVALAIITVLSLVAANVLMNSTTRYNVSSKQVKGWKEALVAAEGGADLAFNEIRKTVSSPSTAFPSTYWDTALPLPTAPQPNDFSFGYTTTHPKVSFGANNNLSATVTVDKFSSIAGSNPPIYYYRIRSIGTAAIGGLRRVGMDDRVDGTTRGDSLLRKIDFSFDHFLSTFGYGDATATAAATTANGKSNATVTGAQVTRRIELIAIPVMPIQGAVQTSGAYSFPVIDSFDSQYGAYPGTPTPSAAPYNTASGQGDVLDGSSSFSGTVYGNVTTNGGTATTNNVTGVVDNNVPLSPVQNMAYTPGSYESQTSGSTITPPARVVSSVTPIENQQQTVFWYHYSSISGLTINPAPALYASAMPSGGIVETVVNIVCDGDVKGITVNKGALARIYFSGNVSGKANSYDNFNVDGPGGNGVYQETSRAVTDAAISAGSNILTSASANFTSADVGNPMTAGGLPSGTKIATVTSASSVTLSAAATATSTSTNLKIGSYTASTNVSRADHLWFYGEGTNQTITLQSGAPSTLYAGWYAPNADWSTSGNPDFVGAAVVKSFTGNGNNTFHYDLELASSTNPLDYKTASYIEDSR